MKILHVDGDNGYVVVLMDRQDWYSITGGIRVEVNQEAEVKDVTAAEARLRRAYHALTPILVEEKP